MSHLARVILLVLFERADVKEPIKMVCCSISNCGNSSTTCNYTNKKITFHRFPQDPDLKDKWISATGKRNWFPTNYSRICSVHFNDEDFKLTTKRRTLNPSAIPTVNIWKLITGNPSDDHNLPSPTREPADPCVSSDSSRKRAFQSVDSADKPHSNSVIDEPEDSDTRMKKKLRREIQAKNIIIAQQRLKIKSLQCKVRRYGKNILKIKDLATSILKEARLRELSLEGSDGNYSWLKTKHHHHHDDVDAYLTELLPVIMKMSPESCTAVAVKLDTVCCQTELSLSSAHILTTLKTLLREQDSMNILAGTVKQAKETKYRKVKVHPMLEGREPTVSFVVYSNKV